MLANLSIKNYALIDALNVNFTEGFTCITGETGAGKSILLGGLSLVLGKRADLSSLRDTSEKCIIEAEFKVDNYDLVGFFKDNDLDYEPITIVRREILPSGKSRAFINDTPVTLNVLTELGDSLIDVHSQHQTMKLTDNDFQLKVIDALADNQILLKSYHEKLATHRKTTKQLEALLGLQREAIKEHDYNSFLFEELEAAPLKAGIQEILEERYQQLSNVENILELISGAHQLMSDEQVGILNLLAQLKQTSTKLASFGSHYSELNQRIESVFIEVDDVADELQQLQDGVEADPGELEQTNAKLQQLYDLQKKHGVADVTELLEIRASLSNQLLQSANLDSDIEKNQAQQVAEKKELESIAKSLSGRRKKVIPSLKKQLQESLSALGMPSATFQIELEPLKTFQSHGKDALVFLFSANKGTSFGELKKVASGGELSRIMLTIKSILAKYEHLPTMMFDEIDTGVSGEISNSMGDIMKNMSETMQVFSITHLPQVASKGHHHFKVYKIEERGTTHTKMKALQPEERVVELAGMLGGSSLTDSALAHARELLAK